MRPRLRIWEECPIPDIAVPEMNSIELPAGRYRSHS